MGMILYGVSALALAWSVYAFAASTSTWHETEGLLGLVIMVIGMAAGSAINTLEEIHKHLKDEAELRRIKNAPDAFKALR